MCQQTPNISPVFLLAARLGSLEVEGKVLFNAKENLNGFITTCIFWLLDCNFTY